MLATTNNASKLATIKQPVNSSFAINNIDDLNKLSSVLAASGFFSDAKGAAQCAVKVLAGLELGFGAFQAMTGIHIIQGKPTVGAGLMASKIRSSGRYDYEVLQQDDSVCSIAVFEVEFKPDVRALKKECASGRITEDDYKRRINLISIGVSTFTIQDAQNAGTQNMKKFPRNMLFARSVSNAVKWFCPDVFGTSVYTPDELGADTDDEGNVINISQYQPQNQQEVMPAPNVDEVHRKELQARLVTTMKEKHIGKDQCIQWSTERYGKATSKDLTIDELQDFVQFLTQLPTDVDVEEIPI